MKNEAVLFARYLLRNLVVHALLFIVITLASTPCFAIMFFLTDMPVGVNLAVSLGFGTGILMVLDRVRKQKQNKSKEFPNK